MAGEECPGCGHPWARCTCTEDATYDKMAELVRQQKITNRLLALNLVNRGPVPEEAMKVAREILKHVEEQVDAEE